MLLEIRFEHRQVILDDWHALVPLVFCGAMLSIILISAIFWRQFGKLLLPISYCFTVAVGLLGVYFHSEGHLVDRLLETLSVWTLNVPTGASIQTDHPPLLAPLAFVGLGSIGLLFSADTNLFLRELSLDRLKSILSKQSILIEQSASSRPSILREHSVSSEPSILREHSVSSEPSILREPVSSEPPVMREHSVSSEPPVMREHSVSSDPSISSKPPDTHQNVNARME